MQAWPSYREHRAVGVVQEGVERGLALRRVGARQAGVPHAVGRQRLAHQLQQAAPGGEHHLTERATQVAGSGAASAARHGTALRGASKHLPAACNSQHHSGVAQASSALLRTGTVRQTCTAASPPWRWGLQPAWQPARPAGQTPGWDRCKAPGNGCVGPAAVHNIRTEDTSGGVILGDGSGTFRAMPPSLHQVTFSTGAPPPPNLGAIV